MTNWRMWEIKDWNEHLLEHFFSTRGLGGFSPVSTLLVTSEELVRAVREHDLRLVTEVRNAFVNAVLNGTPEGRDIFDFATDNDPRVIFNPTVASLRPPIVAYLIFSCLAAAESSGELDHESSYHQRLQKLSNGRCKGNPQALPRLWERFRDWLSLPDNHRLYRRLILPPRNYHTLIGYSERLAFPHRKDQRQLAKILQADDLMGVVPPVGPVLSAVAQNIDSFSVGFREAFQEFQSLYVATPTAPKNFHHQFWSAVVDAALRGREDDNESAAISNRIDLVVSLDGEQLQLYLLSKDACRPPAGTRAVPLNDQIADWKISYPDVSTESLHRGGERAFDGSIRLGRISDGIRAGLLPLIHAWSDYMVVADDPEELAQAKTALVRADKLDDAVRIFGGRSDGCGTADGNWLVVERMDFKRRPPSDHTFSRLRSMQTRIPINRLFLVGGIPCDDGYLGFKEVLPSVRAPGSRVTMQIDGTVHECRRIDSDLWYPPAGQLNGEAKFVSWQDGVQQATLSARFVSHANSENYKSPNSPEALLIEGARGCLPWSDSPSYSSTDGHDDLGLRTGRVILLGRNIGEFVDNVADAAWMVTKTGNGSSRISMADSPVGGLPPEQKLESKGDCRAWCHMLDHSEVDFADLQLSAKRSAVHHMIVTRAPLPIRTGVARFSAPKPYERTTPQRPDILSPFISAIAARASGRSGLPMPEWREMATKILGLNRKTPGASNDSIDAMTRCWIEAGLLDMGISIRWRSRAIFATRPKLVLFKNGKSISAAVVGLTLPATMKTLCADALNHGAAIESKSSPCRLVPETHTFISEDIEVFERVAEKNRIKLEWLRTSPGSETKWAERDRHYPSNYELRYKTDSWSLTGVRSSATLLTHARDDLPTAWSVEGAPERWSYDRNIARLHACAHSGLEPLLAKGAVEIEAKHCYLPLSLARFAAITGPILPGPETTEYAGQGHIYAFGTAAFRDDILQQSKFH